MYVDYGILCRSVWKAGISEKEFPVCGTQSRSLYQKADVYSWEYICNRECGSKKMLCVQLQT